MTSELPLALPVTQTFEDWSDLGRRLCLGARKINWLIGDWLIEGSERFGEKARDEANAIFRSDVERFDPIVKACRRFPADRRHPALTFGHHVAVMAVKDDAEAETLLGEAEAESLTTAALRAKVKVRSHGQGDLVPRDEPDDDPEDTEYRAMVQAWNRAGRGAREMFALSVEEADLGVIDL